MNEISSALQALAADVAEAISAPWGVHDQRLKRWVFYADRSAAIQAPDPGFPSDGWVVRINDNWTHVEEGPASDMLTEVAEVLQTAVMDELGRGWPELFRAGEFAGLLVPRATDVGGGLWWFLRDHQVCRVGDLGKFLTPS